MTKDSDYFLWFYRREFSWNVSVVVEVQFAGAGIFPLVVLI